jgi:hypothetical protein
MTSETMRELTADRARFSGRKEMGSKKARKPGRRIE